MLALASALPAPGFTAAPEPVADPLPSWNDGAAKKAILDFVRVTTDKASPQFVPPEQRIATFDQDGTLWVEHPMYTQLVYCLERVPAVVAKKPELKGVEPFKTVLSGDREAVARLSVNDIEEIAAADPLRHDGGRFHRRREEVAGDREAPALEPAVHRTLVSADAGGDEVSAARTATRPTS